MNRWVLDDVLAGIGGSLADALHYQQSPANFEQQRAAFASQERMRRAMQPMNPNGVRGIPALGKAENDDIKDAVFVDLPSEERKQLEAQK